MTMCHQMKEKKVEKQLEKKSEDFVDEVRRMAEA